MMKFYYIIKYIDDVRPLDRAAVSLRVFAISDREGLTFNSIVELIAFCRLYYDIRVIKLTGAKTTKLFREVFPDEKYGGFKDHRKTFFPRQGDLIDFFVNEYPEYVV